MTEIVVIMDFSHGFEDSKALSIFVKDALEDFWDGVVCGGLIIDRPITFGNSQTIELMESERKTFLVFGVGFVDLLIESFGIFDILDNDVACLKSILPESQFEQLDVLYLLFNVIIFSTHQLLCQHVLIFINEGLLRSI